MIFQQCLALHEKIVKWRGHHVVKKTKRRRLETVASLEKQDIKYLSACDTMMNSLSMYVLFVLSWSALSVC